MVLQSYRDPRETFEINTLGTVNLLEAVRYVPSVKSVVVVTTDKCYENFEWEFSYRENDRLGGHDPYSASKAASELVCTAYRKAFFTNAGVNIATVRSGNVIGGGDWARDRIIPDLIRNIYNRKPVSVRNPDAIRPWQHVLEPTLGYLMLGGQLLNRTPEHSSDSFDDAWNFGPSMESCVPVKQVVEMVIQACGKGSWVDCSKTKQNRVKEAGLLLLSCSKAFLQLGWHPRWSLDEAISQTVHWYDRWAAGENALKPLYRADKRLHGHKGDGRVNNPDSLRQEILDLVLQYYNTRHKDFDFVPGETRISYGGRVYDGEEMVSLVDSCLDFWLTLGPEGPRVFKAFLRISWQGILCSG